VTEYRLLGPLEVVRDGEPVALGGRRQRSTLAILLLDAGRVVSVERLADDLYAGATPPTAVTQVQRQVSELRRLLPEARLETVPPGYVLRVEPEQIDLHRFERLVAQGVERLEREDPVEARAAFGAALDLWRGPALADLANEPFAAPAIGRLEELRLVAHERRLEADVALGRVAEAVPELEQLVSTHPLRERLVELLMLALYRGGRQAQALAVYRAQRDLLADELGLEPGPALRKLEVAILQQDAGLAAARPADSEPVVVAVALEQSPSPTLVAVSATAATQTILLQLVGSETRLTAAAAALEELRSRLGGSARAAAFVAADWGEEVRSFAAAYDAALVVVDAPSTLAAALPATLLHSSPCDVGLVFRGDAPSTAADVYVPFGGGEHDWAALELATGIARAGGRRLKLVGTSATSDGRRDASRLLADAALAVQRAFGIASAPVLAPASAGALAAVVDDGGLVVTGIGSRWRSDGLDPVRASLVADVSPPVILVHRGPRPGVLAPRESRTRFSWSVQY
jgi:DNA-binding SARP family transcriptional activator